MNLSFYTQKYFRIHLNGFFSVCILVYLMSVYFSLCKTSWVKFRTLIESRTSTSFHLSVVGSQRQQLSLPESPELLWDQPPSLLGPEGGSSMLLFFIMRLNRFHTKIKNLTELNFFNTKPQHELRWATTDPSYSGARLLIVESHLVRYWLFLSRTQQSAAAYRITAAPSVCRSRRADGFWTTVNVLFLNDNK